MSAAKSFRYSPCTALLITCLAASGTLAKPPSPGLVGTIHCAYYVHPSGAFRLRVFTPAGITDNQSGVKITSTFMGSIAQWNEVAFVSPEFSSQSPDQILDGLIAGLTTGPYAKKKQKPSLRVRETKSAFGVDCLHAKIYYPEYPGTGVTTFGTRGKQTGADVVGHVHIIPVQDLSSSKTGLPVRYMLVGTMVVTVLDNAKDEGESAHNKFLRRLELTNAAGVRTYDPADTALALWRAAAAGDVPQMEQLLASGANVNATDDEGVTPLMIAATSGCADAVRTLLEKAPGTAITADTTSLVFVAWSGHPDIMLMLLEHGLRVDAVDKAGETALVVAASKGDVEMARILLDHGADAELRSSAKPLIRAVSGDNVEMAKLLIERGADVNRADEKGQTALAVAVNKEIKKMLKEAGARNPN